MSPRANLRPLLFIVTGPSGSGKGTLISSIVEAFPDLRHVPTYTTRQKRPAETDGRDYNFISKSAFSTLVEKGDIFEQTRTYKDDYYGSPRVLLDAEPEAPLLVELDYKGMHRLRAASLRQVVSIFVMPPSREAAEQRILQRHKEGNMLSRLANYDEQIQHAWSYDYVLWNFDLDTFARDGVTVVRAELCRWRGKEALIERRSELDYTIGGGKTDDARKTASG